MFWEYGDLFFIPSGYTVWQKQVFLIFCELWSKIANDVKKWNGNNFVKVKAKIREFREDDSRRVSLLALILENLFRQDHNPAISCKWKVHCLYNFLVLVKLASRRQNIVSKPSMSVFALLPVVFFINLLAFLDLVVFFKNVFSYFIKFYVRVSSDDKYFYTLNTPT